MADPSHETRVEPTVLRSCEIYAAVAEGGWVRRSEGIVAFGCAAGYRAFNQMFITAPNVTADGLADAISWYAAGGGRFRLRMRDEVHDSARAAIDASGLERHGGIPSMTFTGGLPPAAKTDLEVRLVDDEATLADHVRVVAESFDWTTGDLGRVFTSGLLDHPDWTGWVGYANGEPVSSSQLVVNDGVAGLYYVGTVEAARGKGYGDAITRAAIVEGQERTCDLVCLQASPLGRPVYERLGFSVIGEYVTYISKDDPHA